MFMMNYFPVVHGHLAFGMVIPGYWYMIIKTNWTKGQLLRIYMMMVAVMIKKLEGFAIGKIGNKTVLFISLERADALVMYDITSPNSTIIMKTLKTGDARGGLVYSCGQKSHGQKPAGSKQ